MATFASELIDQAAAALLDGDNVRWLRLDLLSYLNAGQREIATYKQEASSIVGNIPLVAGSLQTIPVGERGLLDITRNMGVSGNSPGRAIRLIERESLDESVPNWHSGTRKAEIAHFMTDPRTPTRYYVYPPALPTVVEAVRSVTPEPCVGEQSVVSINDTYLNALLNYMLYRAYEKDSDFSSNDSKSKAHYQLFAAQVGISTEADKATAPRPSSNPNVR
jgi:hypothetical protein